MLFYLPLLLCLPFSEALYLGERNAVAYKDQVVRIIKRVPATTTVPAPSTTPSSSSTTSLSTSSSTSSSSSTTSSSTTSSTTTTSTTSSSSTTTSTTSSSSTTTSTTSSSSTTTSTTSSSSTTMSTSTTTVGQRSSTSSSSTTTASSSTTSAPAPTGACVSYSPVTTYPNGPSDTVCYDTTYYRAADQGQRTSSDADTAAFQAACQKSCSADSRCVAYVLNEKLAADSNLATAVCFFYDHFPSPRSCSEPNRKIYSMFKTTQTSC